jgi:cysteine desulfurase
MRKIYLDHTATTPLDPQVFEAMKPYMLEKFGNASSIHSFGREVRAALDESRDSIAKLLGAHAGEVFFVSGGTEADNTAVKGTAWAMRKNGKSHVITNRTEHHAVLESCAFLEENGFSVTYLEVDQYGMVQPEDVRKAIRPETGLISIIHANNEVGTINPVGDISAIAREHGIPFHSDAVQSFGKLPVNVDELGVDLLTISAHKIYGPKGIGALYIRRGMQVDRFMHGGGQERGRRAGTENVSLSVGFAKAAQLMCEIREAEFQRLGELKNVFRALLMEKFPFIIINGNPDSSLSHILNVSFDNDRFQIDAESMLYNLDLAGIAVTSGSACTSGSMSPSHVLLAMGRSAATARATIRFSMGKSTTEEDLIYAVEKLEEIVKRIGRIKN